MGTALANPCDVCPMPGSCCRNIHLYGGSGVGAPKPRGRWKNAVAFFDQGRKRAMAELFKQQRIPFTIRKKIFSFIDRETGKRASIYSYDCPNLTATGRCGDYANRPNLCRIFTPQVDMPCLLVTRTPPSP